MLIRFLISWLLGTWFFQVKLSQNGEHFYVTLFQNCKQFYVIPDFSAYKTEAFPFQNKPKNLDLSYKMDLDFWV